MIYLKALPFICNRDFSFKNIQKFIPHFEILRNPINNLSYICCMPTNDPAKSFFLFSLSLYTLLYTMFLLNTHARTILLVFFRFQDICHWFDFRSIKMMYPMATIPFPSLWRHQMICLLGQTETLKPNTWFKHTNNMLTHAHGSINNARDCRLQEINQIVLLKLIKRHY